MPRENILQLLPDAVAPPEEELAAYWSKVWKRALAHLGRRPLKLVRHVRGTTFYHKGKLPPVPDAVHMLTIEKREGGEGTRLWVDDLEGLLGLVEIGAVELHPWNASIVRYRASDMLVFDLDPGEGVAWEFVIETARMLRRMLRDQGLEPWPSIIRILSGRQNLPTGSIVSAPSIRAACSPSILGGPDSLVARHDRRPFTKRKPPSGAAQNRVLRESGDRRRNLCAAAHGGLDRIPAKSSSSSQIRRRSMSGRARENASRVMQSLKIVSPMAASLRRSGSGKRGS